MSRSKSIHIGVLYLLVGVALTLCCFLIGGILGPTPKPGADGHNPYTQHHGTANFLTAVQTSTIPTIADPGRTPAAPNQKGLYVGLSTFTIHVPSIVTSVTHFTINNPSADFQFLVAYIGNGHFELSLQASPWMTEADYKVEVTAEHPTRFKDAGNNMHALDFDIEVVAYTLQEGYTMSGHYRASGAYIGVE